MRPLISYYGGKQRMASKIVPLIPPHTVYCEPFAGSASVLFAKPQPSITNGDHYREVLNDINGELVDMYRVAKDAPDLFARSIQAIPHSFAFYKQCKHKTGRKEDQSILTYVAYQQSFSNKYNDGWCRGTMKHNHARTCNAKRECVQDQAKRLGCVYLDSIDALDCIRRWDSPQTFFYIDPPYLGTRIDNMGQWNDADLHNLVKCLNMSSGSFIVSGYGFDGFSLKGVLRKEFQAHCSADATGRTGKSRNHGEPIKSQNKGRTEIIWMRGPAAPVRKSLIPVLEKQTCFTGPLLGPCPLPLQRQAG